MKIISRNLNYFEATSIAIDLAKKHFPSRKIYVAGAGNYPEGRHFRIYKGDIREFDETNSVLILVRVLEHLDIEDIYNLSQSNVAIVSITPDMKASMMRYMDEQKNHDWLTPHTALRAQFEIFNEFHDDDKDRHKWFTTEETINQIPGYKNEYIDEVLLDRHNHLVYIHKPVINVDLPYWYPEPEIEPKILVNGKKADKFTFDIVEYAQTIEFQYYLSTLTHNEISYLFYQLDYYRISNPNLVIKVVDFDMEGYIEHVPSPYYKTFKIYMTPFKTCRSIITRPYLESICAIETNNMPIVLDLKKPLNILK